MQRANFVLLIGVLFSLELWPQAVDSNSITVIVIRSTELRADQVSFALSLTAPLNSDLTSTTTALTEAGIQQVTFAGVSDSSYTIQLCGGQSLEHTLIWNFAVTVPYAQMKDSLAKIAAATKTLDGSNGKPILTFSLAGTSVSDSAIADARRKLSPALIDDAKKEAAQIADGAGMAVGQILGITEGYGSLVGAASSSGRPFFAGTVYGGGGTALPTYTVTSALTVKFAAGR
jgi:Protein of unknown function (DUF541)